MTQQANTHLTRKRNKEANNKITRQNNNNNNNSNNKQVTHKDSQVNKNVSLLN
jgi:hypothetical protein